MDSSDQTTSDSDCASKKTLKCPFPNCNVAYSKKPKLDIHLRKHTGERPFVCDEPGCNKTYTNNSHLRRHKNVSHTEKVTQRVFCEFEGCGAVLANKYSLKKHSRIHSSDHYPYNCNDCSQGFFKKRQLQHHVYVHTGEAAFSCDKCNMSFTTNHRFQKHQRNHHKYTCECGEVLYRWSQMRSHKKYCGKPSLTCEVCSKTFSQTSNLKSHQLIHKETSEKSVFLCTYPDCNRSYLYKRNLKSHIAIFHKNINEGQTFQCTYPNCNKVLKTKRLQKLHLRRHYLVTQKKTRKPRHDKGKPKKSVVAKLLGTGVETGQDVIEISEHKPTVSALKFYIEDTTSEEDENSYQSESENDTSDEQEEEYAVKHEVKHEEIVKEEEIWQNVKSEATATMENARPYYFEKSDSDILSSSDEKDPLLQQCRLALTKLYCKLYLPKPIKNC